LLEDSGFLVHDNDEVEILDKIVMVDRERH
jgi:hypothetical protein